MNLTFKRFVLLSSCFTFMCIFSQCFTGSRSVSRNPLKLPSKNFLPPKLAYVEGGSFVYGGYLSGNPYVAEMPPKRVSVTSFYVSVNKISNRDYLIYLDDLRVNKRYGDYKLAKINDKIWEKGDTILDYLKVYPYSERFLDYPVIAVTPKQAQRYCTWLTEKERKKYAHEKKITSISNNHIGGTGERYEKIETVPILKENSDAAYNLKEKSDMTDIKNKIDNQEEQNEKKIEFNDEEMREDKKASFREEELEKFYDEDGKVIDVNIDEIENDFNKYKEMASGRSIIRNYRLLTKVEMAYIEKATITVQNEDGIETTAIGNYGNKFSSPRYKEGPEKGKLVGLFYLGVGLYKGPPGHNPNDSMTERVDARAANGLGIRGCYGNVWEICYDEFSFVHPDSDYNPVCIINENERNRYDESSPLRYKNRAIEGGSYANAVSELHSFIGEDEAMVNVGFRVAASAC